MTIRYVTLRYMTIRYMTIRYVKKTDAGGVTTAGRLRARAARAGSRVQAGRPRHQLLLKVLLHDRRAPPRRRPTPYARHAHCPLGEHAWGVEEREVGMHCQRRFTPRNRPHPPSSAPLRASHAPTRARSRSRLAARVDRVQGRELPRGARGTAAVALHLRALWCAPPVGDSGPPSFRGNKRFEGDPIFGEIRHSVRIQPNSY
jgi:hypothetical protein